jgi:predicted anti-sigma-YlaC factor YlaD
MNCEQAKELWHGRWDGDLTRQDEALLEIHLSACEGCRTWSAQMEAIDATLVGFRKCTEGMGVDAEFDRPQVPAARECSAWGAARVAAAVALVVGGGLYVALREPAGAVRATPSPVGGPAGRMATVAMVGKSADAFIPVRRETSATGVHVFWLYETPTEEGIED